MAAQAEEIEVYPGYYSVTVVATYQNPVTGEVEDIGQNPGIGQMMVQAQVQSVGYVEIEDDGTTWLNTRWNQADANIYGRILVVCQRHRRLDCERLRGDGAV